MKQTTLKDIALELNISVTTVSKALKNYTDVNVDTKKAVIELANKLNYTPNSIAVNLRAQQTKNIGLIVPSINHQFFGKVIEGVLKSAQLKGYAIIVLDSKELFDLEVNHIDFLINKRVDGLLISLTNQTNTYTHLQRVLDRKIPLVMFDKIGKTIKCSTVKIDDRKAAYNAVTHLINKGYRKIAHFRGGFIPQNSIDRFLGYKKALADNNISFDPKLVYVCDQNNDINDGYQKAKTLLKDHPDVDAIFTITDPIAIGALKYFQEVGVQVPKQIALFGFSNWELSSLVHPKISTVKQPDFEIGEAATNIVISEIEALKKGSNISHQSIVLPTSLEIRESTI